ncbi:MAG: hypothetical protein SWH68_08510 [Thermodesulfobacteriota bacterium]|nr:hypothetical protein [Thermodesulfobacteriota bacterium]
MAKKTKMKLTSAQKRAKKAAKKERQKKYQWVFMNGKQKRIKRPATIDGMDVDEFIRQSADPIWLHQNEMWEYIEMEENSAYRRVEDSEEYESNYDEKDDEIPF